VSGSAWYARLLRRQEWFDFRERCLEKAGRACIKCGRTQREAALQVHHPHYAPGLMPWDYKIGFCEVLCSRCHAIEHGLEKPREGWILVHSDWDVGESSGETRCEHCNADMSWHNDLFHPDWGVIVVGYDCAEKLCNGDTLTMKKRNGKRLRFIESPCWYRTPKGWRYKYRDNVAFIYEKDGYHTPVINGVWGRRYSNEVKAKVAAFNMLFPEKEGIG
jgi:hypothetical protein